MNANSLSSLLWWIVIGGVFFWMMRRGGCGSMAHGHGGHGGHGESSSSHGDHVPGAVGYGDDAAQGTAGQPIDPVCGMPVEPARAVGTRLVGGKTFFFCSQTCLDAFDRNPEAYPGKEPAGAGAGHRHAGC